MRKFELIFVLAFYVILIRMKNILQAKNYF